MIPLLLRGALLLSLLVPCAALWAQPRLGIEQVKDGLYMITGPGGNIGVRLTAEGVILIDDKFPQDFDEIQSLIASVSALPVRYVINTHHHGDHTGGNDYFAGLGATLVASDAARVRLLARAPSPDTPLPVITYDAGISIYFNGDRLRLVAMQGHTDGDTAVLFERANVLHAGDLFFNGRFPYIDLDSGGGVSDYLNSQERMLALIDNDTRVVPGHGPLASKQDLLDTYQMIKTTRAAVEADVASGLSLTAIQEKGVSPVYKRFAWNFITEARWLELLYLDVAATGPGA